MAIWLVTSNKKGISSAQLACDIGVTQKTATHEIITYVTQTAELYTDEWFGYNRISALYSHHIIHHKMNEYVNGKVFTNTIEGFWSTLKRGILGIYHFWSKKHLQKYVDEFVFRYNTRNLSDHARFDILLNNCTTKTTYQELIYG